MMAGFKTFWHDLTQGRGGAGTYRVAFAAPFRSSTVELYMKQVAGYVQLFTSGRLQPTFFYNLSDQEGQAQFTANIQVFPYDAVVCIGSSVTRFLLQTFGGQEKLRIPTLSISYREMNGGDTLPYVKESSAPNNSGAQFRVISQMPTKNRHLLFCASERGLACVPGNKQLIALLREDGVEVSTVLIGGKQPLSEVFADKGSGADLLFLSDELVVEQAVKDLITLGQQHNMLTISVRLGHMAYGIDCAVGYSEEKVCRRAGELVACMVQGKPANADVFSNIPLEFHVNPDRFQNHKEMLGKVGYLLSDSDLQVRLYTKGTQGHI